ncbi:MAG: lysoplasmalogenase [Oceanicoccus sp.]
MKHTVLFGYVVFSLIYIFSGDTITSTLGTTAAAMFKVIPVGFLIFLSLIARADKWLPIALIFGACGDTLLAYNLFVPGLSAFLIGHGFYIILWSKYFDPKKRFNVIPAIFFGGAISFFLLPFLGGMAVPVVIYIGVIALMAASASTSSLVNLWGILGVYSFLLSDLLIAWDRFVEPVPMSGLLIMATYYFAQAAICYNVVSKSDSLAATQ